jgi:DNA-directed RNA polymerase specialized sigma24 family protein
MDAYLACDVADVGPTDYADHTDRAKGTVGNLLSRARQKVNGGGER